MFTKNRKGALILFSVFLLSAFVPLKLCQSFFPLGQETTSSSTTPLIGIILMTSTMLLVLGIFFAIGFWYATRSISQVDDIHFGNAGAIRWACTGLILGSYWTLEEYSDIRLNKILFYLIGFGTYYIAFKVFRPVEKNEQTSTETFT